MAMATGGEEDGGRSPHLLRRCLGLLRGFEEDFKEKALA
uniref:OSJNBa0009K15.3 protein n=1 Tax=Oryza sativa subsp. japonica TaxID=39947 RepID=Q7XLK7_ORYSJ|nr:OSJNBa0009K15.3 [Oryza sativa Japonica Group]